MGKKTCIKIMAVVLLLLTITGLKSQTYLYDGTKTINGNGYVYQCDDYYGLVKLYNKTNQHTYSLSYKYKNGTPFTNVLDVSLIEEDDWTKPLSMNIVNTAFTPSEKQKVLGQEISIVMIINTTDGSVSEVNFCFDPREPFAEIPVGTYRNIELALKQQISFTLTSIGKQLEFVKVGWMHKVE